MNPLAALFSAESEFPDLSSLSAMKVGLPLNLGRFPFNSEAGGHPDIGWPSLMGSDQTRMGVAKCEGLEDLFDDSDRRPGLFNKCGGQI